MRLFKFNFITARVRILYTVYTPLHKTHLHVFLKATCKKKMFRVLSHLENVRIIW